MTNIATEQRDPINRVYLSRYYILFFFVLFYFVSRYIYLFILTYTVECYCYRKRETVPNQYIRRKQNLDFSYTCTNVVHGCHLVWFSRVQRDTVCVESS